MLSTRASVMNLFVRRVHSNAELIENCKSIRNRNPRNLERLKIGRKLAGYHLEKPGKCFWNKLVVKPASRFVKAEVQHFGNGTIISASTNEWAIKSQLYRYTDTSAYINLSRVLSRRCLEAGIIEMTVDPSMPNSSKVTLFLEELRKNGLILEEGERYVHPKAWDPYRPERTWEFYE